MTLRTTLTVVTMALLSTCGCSRTSVAPGKQAAVAHTNAPALMIQYGCTTCHVIPHVPGAVGKVGPSLNSLSQRSYLAGSLPNTPENLERWIMHPQQYRPGTAMPEMGVSEQDAHIISTYLDGRP